MYLKSPFPSPPPFPYTNVHDYFFRDAPGLADRPRDITIHIDAITGKTRTWGEFLDRVKDGATALGVSVSDGGLGLKSEDKEMIGIISDNCLDYLTLVHCLWAITVPFALISSHSTPFELERALQVSQATRLFIHSSLLSRVLPVAGKMGIVSARIYILEGDGQGYLSLEDLVSRVRINSIPRIATRPAGKNTLAYMAFSSGTSGPPKAVMISHGNILAIMRSYQVVDYIYSLQNVDASKNPGEDKRSRALAFLPLHHCYGLIMYSARSLQEPSTLVILPRWDLDLALDLIVKYRVTTLALIPSVVVQMVNSPKFWKTDLSSVGWAGSGAAYLPPELAKKFASKLSAVELIAGGYGMSEGTVAMSLIPMPGTVKDYVHAPGSCGVLLPGTEARILRDDGSEADLGEPGNLFFRGPNVSLGYYNNKKATEEIFSKDGWLNTGDKFRSDGVSLFFEDRAKDTLKISGIQVSPREIEDVLLVHQDNLVVDAVVAGVSGGRTSDEKIPRAWVVLSDSAKEKQPQEVLEALKSWSEQSLSKYKWLRGGIEIVDEIPKSPTGKVLRRVLQDRYEESLRKTVCRL